MNTRSDRLAGVTDPLIPEVILPTRNQRAVNVSQVPQYSPYRYPGGKSWFVPRLRKWLGAREERPRVFVEPFAGGGSSSCAVAIEGLAETVVMAELDVRVAAVWQVIFGHDGLRFAERIETYAMTPEAASRILASEPTDLFEIAWRTLVQNRVSHGGKIGPGGGILKSGEAGKGVLSRWYPETLGRRIRALHAVRDRVQVVQGDALELLAQYAGDEGAAVFIDPPYTAGGKKAGARLYTHSVVDHARMFELAAEIPDIVMTYDISTEVRELARQHDLQVHEIAMRNTHNAVMDELLIGRDLSWNS